MKRIFTLMLAMAMMVLSFATPSAAADYWQPFNQSTNNGYGYTYGTVTRVEIFKNETGQTCHQAYDAYGNLLLDIRGRGGNIWNETTKVLMYQNNMGQEYIIIAPNLDVYGLDATVRTPLMFRSGFKTGDVPYSLNTIATGFLRNTQKVGIGIYTQNGLKYLQNNYTNSNYNYNYSNNYNYGYNYGYNYNYNNNEYPKVIQNGEEYQYYYNSAQNFSYEFDADNETLEYRGSRASGITEIAFGTGYLYAITTSNKVVPMRVGTLERQSAYSDRFQRWIYDSNNNRNGLVVGFIDVNDDRHYFNEYQYGYNYDDDYWYDDDDYWYDDDDYWYDDDDYWYDDYPYFEWDDDELVYYKSSSKEYTYTLTSAGKFKYGSTTIDTDVEIVEVAEGYIVYVVCEDEDDDEYTCYKVKVGSTSKTKVCSDFEEFEYDNDGFVTEVINSSGRSYEL